MRLEFLLRYLCFFRRLNRLNPMTTTATAMSVACAFRFEQSRCSFLYSTCLRSPQPSLFFRTLFWAWLRVSLFQNLTFAVQNHHYDCGWIAAAAAAAVDSNQRRGNQSP